MGAAGRVLRVLLLAVAMGVPAACSPSPHRVAGRLTVPPDPPPSGPGATAATAVPGPAAPSTPSPTPPTVAQRPAPSGPPATVVASSSGVVLPVVARQGAGWLVSTPCGATATVQAAQPVGPVAVVLDPGHGGDEAGAVGPNGLTEQALNLAVAKEAQGALQRAGLTVALTRTGAYRMTLGARARVVMALRPRAFVSIHHNAEPDGPWPRPGSETYYQVASPDSKRLAGLVYEEVVRALDRYKLAWAADTDAGAKYRRGQGGDDYYAMLRQTHGVVSALAELAYISNPPEAELLARADVQKVEGEAVARGIVRYLTTRDPGSGFTEPYPRTEPAGPGGGSSGCVDPPL